MMDKDNGLERKYSLSYQLQFFAESSGAEKTEDATSKRLSDARKEGQVAKSIELTTGVALVTIFLCLKIFIGYIGDGFINSFYLYYGNISKFTKEPVLVSRAQSLINDVIVAIILLVLPLMLISMVVAFITTLVQVKWQISTKPLEPKFNKFNPITGFKRMFGKDKIFELIKSIVKIVVIFLIVYQELKDSIGFLSQLYSLTLMQAIALVGDMVINLGLKISYIYFGIGFVDYIYQKRKFKKDMRMSKQEVKDEFKQTEGDPQIKGRIRQKMREVSTQRMMKQLPEADVVITNPTHLAVAIKYDRSAEGAPIVIAKGADHLAARIREVAKENQIEIVENKPLARMLYFNVEIGQEIPSELYQMVAEVLAYVYKLKNQ